MPKIVSRSKKNLKNVVLLKNNKLTKAGLSRLAVATVKDPNNIRFKNSFKYAVYRGKVTKLAVLLLQRAAKRNPPKQKPAKPSAAKARAPLHDISVSVDLRVKQTLSYNHDEDKRIYPYKDATTMHVFTLSVHDKNSYDEELNAVVKAYLEDAYPKVESPHVLNYVSHSITEVEPMENFMDAFGSMFDTVMAAATVVKQASFCYTVGDAAFDETDNQCVYHQLSAQLTYKNKPFNKDRMFKIFSDAYTQLYTGPDKYDPFNGDFTIHSGVTQPRSSIFANE